MRADPQAEARTVEISARKITLVLAAGPFESEMSMLLAIGAACPFERWAEKEIWLRVFHRSAELAGYYVKGAS